MVSAFSKSEVYTRCSHDGNSCFPGKACQPALEQESLTLSPASESLVRLQTAEIFWDMDVGIVNSVFKVDGLDREARSFLIEGGGTIFQKAGERIC